MSDTSNSDEEMPGAEEDFQFEMDCGETTTASSILRREPDPDKQSSSADRRKRISWADDQAGTALETRRTYEGDGTKKKMKKVTRKPYKKRAGKATEADSPVVANADGDDDEAPLISKRAPKRKYEKKKKVAKVETPPQDDDEERPLLMHEDDSDDEPMLMIAEPDEETDDKQVKKKRRSIAQIREERKETQLEITATLKSMDGKVMSTEETHAICDTIVAKIAKPRKEFVRKSMEQIKEEVEQFAEMDPAVMAPVIRAREDLAYHKWSTELRKKLQEDSDSGEELDCLSAGKGRSSFWGRPMKAEPMESIAEAEVEAEQEEAAVAAPPRDVIAGFDDMPDMDELINAYKQAKAVKECEEEEEKVEKVEATKKRAAAGGGGKKKNKKMGGKAGKKTKEDAPQTEAEVIAQIGRKKADASEKAERMKKQKAEDAERRALEREQKREEDDAAREEKRRKKAAEREVESRKKEESERGLMDRKPRSRAEAARRTKALLTLGSGGAKKKQQEEPESQEEDDEPVTKKRKYRKRTMSVPFRRYKTECDEEGGVVGCGRYVDNPCDVAMDSICTLESLESDGESDGEVDDLLSIGPFVWTSDKDKLPEGAIGPQNFDADEPLKRQLNDVVQFGGGLTEKYHEMTARLDGMTLNLFADTTFRRFDHRVVHNIDTASRQGTWHTEFLPADGVAVPKYQHQMWINRPFTGLVRIRPSHTKKAKLVSADIDKLTNAPAQLTKQDIVTNLDDLIMAKLKKRPHTHLPSTRNPYDVPEISTRKKPAEVRDYRSSYVQKTAVINIPAENTKKEKQRKRTRKELLIENASKPKPAVTELENIYKEAEEPVAEQEGGGGGGGHHPLDDDEDAYRYGWDELGEIVDNPMRDNDQAAGDDPFAANPYDGVEYDEGMEEVTIELDETQQFSMDAEEEDETELGGAFSFMANHMDV